jgi:hypothetical protein
MSLHLLQPRSLILEDEEYPSFPAEVTAELAFGPEDVFGTEDANPRTTFPVGERVTLRWNANVGISEAIADGLIDALDVSLEVGKFHLCLEGNCLKVRFKASSSEEAEAALASANHCIPAYLSLHFGVYVWIKQYAVDIGGSRFNYQVKRAHSRYLAADKDMMSNRASSALEDWLEVGGGYDRALAACLYLRHAHRLSRIQPNNHHFIAEVLLNLTKSLEIVFSDNRDQIRKRAHEWGFDDALVEQGIIPLFLIRNRIDVAHVSTGILKTEERDILLDFMNKAIENTGKVLKRIIELIKDGEISLGKARGRIRGRKRRLLANVAEYLKQN